MSSLEKEARLVRDFDYLVISVEVYELKNKSEVSSLSRSQLLFDIDRALKSREDEGYQVQLYESSFETRLLDMSFTSEINLVYKFTEDFSQEEYKNREFEFVIRLKNLKNIYRESVFLDLQYKELLEKKERVDKENEKLRSERERAQRDFTSKIKTIELDLSSKVKEGMVKREEELISRFKGEMELLKLYGSQSFFSDFLPHFLTLKTVINSGKNSTDKTLQAYILGFEMVVRTMNESLSNFGVEEIVPELGEEFNSTLHVGEETACDTLQPEGVILEVKRNGYKLHDRLLIPAVVVVNKH